VVDTSEAYTLSIGGVRVELSAESPTTMRLLPAVAARPFLVDPAAPDAALVAGWRELDARPPGELVFDTGGSWRLYRRGGVDVYRFFDGSIGTTPYKEAELGPGGCDGRVWLDPRFHSAAEPVDPLQFPLDELVFLRLLAERDAVELHACGVVTRSGHGLVFAGQSGDGKTTTARLWAGQATILSDDRVVIRRDDAGLWAYGTPWHGEARLAASVRAPLAAVLVLGRGERDAIERLSPARALSLFLARSFPPFHDAERLSRTLASLAAVVDSVPCALFSFVPAPGAVESVLEWLSNDAVPASALR
jgi:hypothetical protein